MEILKYLFQLPNIAIILGTILAVLASTLFSNRDDKKGKKIFKYSSFVGAFLLLIAGLISGREQSNLNEKLIRKSNTIERLQSDIIKKTDDIKKLNSEIRNFQTGGDSYCYFEPVGQERFILKHEGKYPLQNVTCVYTDIGNHLNINSNIFTMPRGKIELGTVFGNTLSNFDFPYYYSSVVGIEFLFQYGKRKWKQHIRFIRDGKNYEYAYCIQVYEEGGNCHVIDEFKTEGFPLTEENKIKWFKDGKLLCIDINMIGDVTNLNKYVRKMDNGFGLSK